MKFTLVFSTFDDYDISYGLAFVPCPVWVHGTMQILNLNPETPEYQPGSVRRLLDQEGIEGYLAGQNVSVVIHQTGIGSQSDLDGLLDDLRSEGFWPSVYG